MGRNADTQQFLQTVVDAYNQVNAGRFFDQVYSCLVGSWQRLRDCMLETGTPTRSLRITDGAVSEQGRGRRPSINSEGFQFPIEELEYTLKLCDQYRSKEVWLMVQWIIP